MARLGQVGNLPYTPYGGELTAPVNQQQMTGIGNLNAYSESAQPAIDTAEGMAYSAAQPITSGDINQYMSPYTQDVVNTTEAQFQNQNQQQMEGVQGNAISQGALGGNREAVAQAETANQQNLAQAPVIAGLENQGYTTGLNTALTEQQALASGAYGLGNLGVSGQNAALSGAGAQIGAGTLEQQTQQAQDTAAYQQFMQQQAFPYQQAQWLAGNETGVGSQMGGTGTTTPPPPSWASQALGLGALGSGLFGSQGALQGIGSAGSSAISSFGEAFPEVAAMMFAPFGFKHGGVVLDHHDLRAVMDGRRNRANGGGVARGYDGGGGVTPFGGVAGSPFGTAQGYIPVANIAKGNTMPKPPGLPQQPSPADQAKAIGQLTQSILGKPQTPAQLAAQDATQDAAQDAEDDAAGVQPNASLDSGLYYRGGGVRGYADGGGPDDSDDVILGPDAGVLPTDTGLFDPSPTYPIKPRMKDDLPPSGSVWPDTGIFDPNLNNNDAPLEPTGINVGDVPTPREPPLAARMEFEPTGDYDTRQALAASAPRMIAATKERYKNDPLFPHDDDPDVSTAGIIPVPRERPKGIDSDDASVIPAPASARDIPETTGSAGVGPRANVSMRREAELPGNSTVTAGVAPSGIDFSKDSKLWPALMAAGLGMLASRSPYAGVGIGEGGLMGMQQYSNATQQETANKMKQSEIDQKAKTLQMQAEQHLAQISTPHVMYEEEDSLGNTHKVYGSYDPKTGQWVPTTLSKGFSTQPPSRTTAPQSDQPVLTPVAYNEAVRKLPVELRGPDTPRNEDYLSALPEADRGTVQGLVNYQVNPATLSIKGGHREHLINEAINYDPTYDQSLYPAKQAAMKEFYAGGPNSPAGTMTAGNTAILHAAEMSDALEKFKDNASGVTGWLGRQDIPFVSYYANEANNRAIKGTTAGAALSEFETARQRFSEEVTKFYAGSNGSQTEREHALALLDGAKSLPELRAAIQQDARLMKDKVEQLKNRLIQGMGPTAWRNALIRDPEGVMIYKNSHDAFDKIQRRYNEGNQPTGPSPSTPSSSIPAPADRVVGQVYTNPQGKRATWTGNGWKPVE